MNFPSIQDHFQQQGKIDKIYKDFDFIVLRKGYCLNGYSVSRPSSFYTSSVSTNGEMNKSFVIQNNYGSSSPVLYIINTKNKQNANYTQVSRVMSELGTNGLDTSSYNSAFAFKPLDAQGQKYFIYLKAAWTTPIKYATGIIDTTTANFTSWTTDNIFIASEVAGYYYVYNTTTKYLKKIRSSDNQEIWSVYNASFPITVANNYPYVENTNYIYIVELNCHFNCLLTNGDNTSSVKVYRVNKTTGEIITFVSSISNVGTGLKIFATDNYFYFWNGVRWSLDNSSYTIPIRIYDANTGNLVTTTTPVPAPIMYDFKKNLFICRAVDCVNYTQTYKYLLFDVATNSVKKEYDCMNKTYSQYGGGNNQTYTLLFWNEAQIYAWEHSKRYLLNQYEDFNSQLVASTGTTMYFPLEYFTFYYK